MGEIRDQGLETQRSAYAEGRATGAFSTYTLEITQGIVRASEQTGMPAILVAGASAFSHAGLAELAAQAVRAADLAEVPAGVHLDHSRDLGQIRACPEAGYTSVMVDGSHLSFEDNVALTTAAVETARPCGAWVEADLDALARAMPAVMPSADLAGALHLARDAVREVVRHKILALAGASVVPGAGAGSGP